MHMVAVLVFACTSITGTVPAGRAGAVGFVVPAPCPTRRTRRRSRRRLAFLGGVRIPRGCSRPSRRAVMRSPGVMHTPLMSPGRCTRQLAVPSDCVRLSLRTELFMLTMPARWSAKFDQPVTGLAVAAELPWVWIPRTISPGWRLCRPTWIRRCSSGPSDRLTTPPLTRPSSSAVGCEGLCCA
jgi:hypothetical protein